MAIRNVQGLIPARPFQLQRDEFGAIPPAEMERMAKAIEDLQGLQAGGMSLGTGQSSFAAGFLRGQYVDFVFTLAATAYSIPHGLGVVPIGALAVMQNLAGSFYDVDFGLRWSANKVVLACSVANVKAKLLIFA